MSRFKLPHRTKKNRKNKKQKNKRRSRSSKVKSLERRLNYLVSKNTGIDVGGIIKAMRELTNHLNVTQSMLKIMVDEEKEKRRKLDEERLAFIRLRAYSRLKAWFSEHYRFSNGLTELHDGKYKVYRGMGEDVGLLLPNVLRAYMRTLGGYEGNERLATTWDVVEDDGSPRFKGPEKALFDCSIIELAIAIHFMQEPSKST